MSDHEQVPEVARIGIPIATIIIGVVLVLLGVAAVRAHYLDVGSGDGIASVDQPVLEAMVEGRTATLNNLVGGFTRLGGEMGVTVLTAASGLIIAWWRRVLWPLLLIMVGSVGAAFITTWAKAGVGRPRPPTSLALAPFESTYAFPSGHALSAVAVAGLIAYVLVTLLPSRVGRVVAVVGAIVWAMAMGLSRIYLGHHWLTDVLAAWALGIVWLVFVIGAHRIYLIFETRRADTATPTQRHTTSD